MLYEDDSNINLTVTKDHQFHFSLKSMNIIHLF